MTGTPVMLPEMAGKKLLIHSRIIESVASYQVLL